MAREMDLKYSLTLFSHHDMFPEMIDGYWDVREDGEEGERCALKVDRRNEVED